MDNQMRLRLLMFTQKVDLNDPILGFVHQWIEELSKNIEELYIITSYLGKHNLSENIKIFSLGKERGNPKWRRLIRIYKIILPLFMNRRINAIWSHQIQHFVLAIAPVAGFFNIPIYLFYAHGAISFSLKAAAIFTKKIFTSTDEGLRLNTSKKIIIGQGIDTNYFRCDSKKMNREKKKILLSVGRISPIKDQETLIKAAEIIKSKGLDNFLILFVGDILLPKDKGYKEKLILLIKKLNMEDYIRFIGAVSHKDIKKYYCMSDIYINTALGALDKSALEAMSCERLCLVTNEAFRNEFKDFEDIIIFKEKEYNDLANKIISLLTIDENIRRNLTSSLRERIIQRHNLENLMKRIVKEIEDSI